MSSEDTLKAPQSSKSYKHDVDEFLNSLGLDPEILSKGGSVHESTSNSEDVLSFLNDETSLKPQQLTTEKEINAIEPGPEKKSTEIPIEASTIKKTEAKNNNVLKEQSKSGPLIKENETKQVNSDAHSGWSFGSLWSSASTAIKNTHNSESLLSNVVSVKTALSGLSETVRSNENARYLGSAVKGLMTSENINKIGNNLKSFTQHSVASVLTTFQGPDIHQTLNVYLLTDQKFSDIETLSYQLLDPLMSEELLFQDVFFLDAKELLEIFLPDAQKQLTTFNTSLGFTEGFNAAKIKSKILFDAFENYAAQKKEKNKEEDILSQIEKQVLTPTTTTSIFIVCQPCRAAPLPDSASFFYCLTLLSPQHSDAPYRTFSQPLPNSTNLSSQKQSPTEKNTAIDEKHRQLSLKAIQLALEFLLVDFFEAESKLRKEKSEKEDQKPAS